jgi:hypothetical protein
MWSAHEHGPVLGLEAESEQRAAIRTQAARGNKPRFWKSFLPDLPGLRCCARITGTPFFPGPSSIASRLLARHADERHKEIASTIERSDLGR